MDTRIPETTARHLAGSSITAVARTTLPVYEGSPVPTDHSRGHSGTAEDYPAPAQSDAKDQPADAETALFNIITQMKYRHRCWIYRYPFKAGNP